MFFTTDHNLEANPTMDLVTRNPALSIPYIKYYTNMLEEYNDLHGATDILSKITLNINDDTKNYEYNNYLLYEPYYSMNPLPLMRVYVPTKESIVSNSISEEMLSTIRNKDKSVKDIVETNDTNTGPMPNDIILTYRRIKNKRRLGTKESQNSTDEFDARFNNVVKDMILGWVNTTPIGCDERGLSHIIQYVIAYLYEELSIEMVDVTVNGDPIAHADERDEDLG